MQKIRLLLVIRWPVGGIRTFIRYVYMCFDCCKWQVTILAPDLLEMEVLARDLKALDIKYIPTGNNPGVMSFTRQVALELSTGNYDLVHSQGFTSGLCSALPAWLFRVPHMMTSHDVFSKHHFDGGKGQLKKFVMKNLFNLINIIHSVSHDAHDNFLEYFPTFRKPLDKCVVVLNGIEVDRFACAEPRDLRKEYELNDGLFLIGFLGRFMRQKGFRYLVDAIEILTRDQSLNINPYVLTFNEGGFFREEKQSVKELGLDEFFSFLPFAPNVSGTIKGLDLVVMPSLWEACPLLPMEVLSCGTPLIASSCIGLREVVKGTPTFVVAPKNAKDLSSAIKFHMANDEKISFIEFAITARQKFDVKERASEIEALLEGLL